MAFTNLTILTRRNVKIKINSALKNKHFKPSVKELNATTF